MKNSNGDKLPEYKQEMYEEQSEMSREQIKEEMTRRGYALDLDDIRLTDHHIVDRGVFKVCEGAGHPSHRYSVR